MTDALLDPVEIAQDCLLQAGIAREMGAGGDAASLERAAETLTALVARVRQAEQERDLANVEAGEAEESLRVVGLDYENCCRTRKEAEQERDTLREAARAVVKAGWALSETGHLLPDVSEAHAFDDALNALETTLREIRSNEVAGVGSPTGAPQP